MQKILVLAFSVCLFFACGKKQSSSPTSSADSVPVAYATGFSINKMPDYKSVVVFNPWKKGAVYARYYLVENENAAVPADGVRLKIPLQTVAVGSATHLEFLNLLGKMASITGVCTPHLIYNENVRRRSGNGEIADLGDAFAINVEKTMVLNPNALMVSGFNQTDAHVQRIEQAGIPVIYNNEWMESSPLGRAEWIKFVAAFYNQEAAADSIFREIESRYNDLKTNAENAEKKPTILAGTNFRGTWYMPGGRSFMNELFRDAGGDYFYANDTTAGSLPLQLEVVLNHFSEADVWLNCNFSSIHALIQADEKYALFRPAQTHRVYNFNKRMLPSTANDFWESAVARPDWLLGDVISILHPDLLPDWERVYAEQLTP